MIPQNITNRKRIVKLRERYQFYKSNNDVLNNTQGFVSVFDFIHVSEDRVLTEIEL